MLPPKPLSEAAMARWIQLEDSIDPRVSDLLAVYCEAAADWREASEKVNAGGRLVKDKKGKVMPSPWLAIRDHAAIVMERLALSLGLGLSPDILVAESREREDAIIDGLTVTQAIAVLRACGGIIKDAAARMDISRRAFYRKFYPIPAVKEALTEIRDELLDLSEGTMLGLVRAKDRESTKYYLNCFGKERGWVPVTRLEGSGGGGALVVKIAKDDQDL